MVAQRTTMAGLAALGMATQIAAAPMAAAADPSVQATYAATLAGFPVGSGTLNFTVSPSGDYKVDLGAQVRGLATLVADRSAVAVTSGKTIGGQVVSRAYNLAIDGGPQPNHVDMDFNGGAVTQVSATELHFPGWDRRIPLLPEHKRGVVDPLAAFVLPIAPGREPMAQANCDRTARVFDGRVRYDLRMVYGARMEVQAKDGGYAGPALVCAVNYKPIAGYRPLSPEEEKFERNLEFSIWFVPVPGSNVLIPYRVVVATPIGLLQIYAHHFTATGTRSAEASATSEPAAAETTGSVPVANP